MNENYKTQIIDIIIDLVNMNINKEKIFEDVELFITNTESLNFKETTNSSKFITTPLINMISMHTQTYIEERIMNSNNNFIPEKQILMNFDCLQNLKLENEPKYINNYISKQTQTEKEENYKKFINNGKSVETQTFKNENFTIEETQKNKIIQVNSFCYKKFEIE